MFPIFLWVKKYKGLENTQIILDGNYDVKLKFFGDGNLEKIEIDYEKKIAINYARNIDSVTAIIGKNGSGKTSVLEILSNFRDPYDKRSEYFIIYKISDKNNKYLIEGFSEDADKFFKGSNIKMNMIMGNQYSFVIGKDYKFISFSGGGIGAEEYNCHKSSIIFIKNTRNIPSFYEQQKDNDIRAKQRPQKIINNYELNSNSETYKTIFKLKKDSKKYKNLNFSIKILDYSRSIYKSFFDESILPSEDEYKVFSTNLKDIKNLEHELLKNIVNNLFLIDEKNKIKNIDKDEKKKLIFQNDRELYKKKDLKNSLKELCEKIYKEVDCSDFSNTSKDIADTIIEFCTIFKELTYNEKNNYFELLASENLPNENIIRILKNFDKNMRLRKYKDGHDTAAIERLFSFKIQGASDGEEDFINQFSAISSAIEESFLGENITLIFDEYENYFHPELARIFLYELTTFLHNNHKEIKFKLIFATHSPFLLSDITRENCIIMDKDTLGEIQVKKCEIDTFGANIHDLLKNGMFIEYFLGEISRVKIEWIIKVLKSNTKLNRNKREIKYIIDSIGESIMKNILTDLYDEKLQKDENKVEKLQINNEIENVIKNSDLSKGKKEKILNIINAKN